MKIIFMGTPELARECLRALHEKEGVELSAVVTRPDQQKGRGMKLLFSPVKEYALAHGIPVYQPKTLRDGAFQSVLDELQPELIAVAAYGNILPPYVLEYPRYGCINAHGSLLPKYRGASPIQRAILDGERETGITAMRMDSGIDTGELLKKYPCPIEEDDDYGSLSEKLARLAGIALCEAVDALADGTAVFTPQSEEGSCYAAKIEKEDTVLDFSDSAVQLRNRIRALSPEPGAVTKTPDGKLLKLTSSVVLPEASEEAPGTVVFLNPKGSGCMAVACGEGLLGVTGVVPEGKKPMTAGDFIRGRRISVGDRLGETKETE